MAADKLAEGRGARERGHVSDDAAADEGEMMMMNNSSSKAGGSGAAASAAYRWSGDAVPLKRRRVGLSNGGSVSDGGSLDDEEEEDEQEEDIVTAEDMSAYEEEYEEDEDNERFLMTDRGGSNSSRGEEEEREPESVGFDDHEAGTEDDAFDEDPVVADSPIVSGGDQVIEREVSSRDDDVRQVTDDSDEETTLPISRGAVEQSRASASEPHRELEVIPEKVPKGGRMTTKRKAEAAPRNGGEPKPKKKSAPRKVSNADGAVERNRFSTDNKARVTLERAREILAAVKASMMKDRKQCSVRRTETHTVEKSCSSDDERVHMQLPPPRVMQQKVKSDGKASKKRSRAPKEDKEPTPRRRKPKMETGDHGAQEKPLHRKSNVESLSRENAVKLGHYSTSSVEVTRDGGYFNDEDCYEKKESSEGDLQKKVVEKKVRKRRKPKEAENGPPSTGLCPGSVIRDENWKPPTSPFGLIQESLYEDPWKVLLSCMLLNKTAGRQMHKVIWDLFALCPDAQTAVTMDTDKIAEKVYSLGLQNKRAKMIQRFSHEYLRGDWTNVTQLHGIGKYAADAYAIFCQGLWREVEPDDIQLVKYWKWLWETNGSGSAFVPEDS